MKGQRYGLFFILLSSIFFTVMGICVKIATRNLSPVTVVFFRSFLGMMLVLFVVKFRIKQIIPSACNTSLVIGRGVLGATALILSFYSLKYAYLANATALFFTYPFFVTIFSRIFLKEELPRPIFIVVTLSILGMIFIVKPRLGVFNIGELLALGAGLCAGATITMVRHLRKAENTHTIVFSFLLFASIMSLIGGTGFGVFSKCSPKGFILLMFIALFGTLAQYLMTYAYKYCKASEGGILSLSSVGMVLVAGVIIFDEVPDIFSFLGILLIFVSSSLIFKQAVIDKKDLTPL